MTLKKPIVLDVIFKYYPTAKFNQINGDDWEHVEWVDEDIPKPSDKEISTKLAEMQSEWEAQEYARNRASAYPSIGDQLDMIYKDNLNSTTTHKDAVEAIKKKWPKDNSGPV